MSLAKQRVTFNLSANVVRIIDDGRSGFDAQIWRDARNGTEWTLSAARRSLREMASESEPNETETVPGVEKTRL